MGHHPELLGLLILACSVNLLPTPKDADTTSSNSSVNLRQDRRSDIDARAPIKFPNNYILLPCSTDNFVRSPPGGWSNKGARNQSRATVNDGSDPFVFPDELGAAKRFTPKFGKVQPECAQDGTFCENVDDYPSSYIENVLQNNALEFKGMFGNDTLNNIPLVNRIDSGDTALCPSLEQVVYPKSAKNKDDQWLFVINQDKYQQGVRIEKCVAPDGEKRCAFTEFFPLGYVTSCKQKHIYRKLLALDKDGKTITDQFRLPSCCACTYRTDALRSSQNK